MDYYDAIFHALGARRTFESDRAIAYGRDHEQFWIVARGRTPAPGYGHVALAAAGRAAVNGGYDAGLANGGGDDDGPPGVRPQYGPAESSASADILPDRANSVR